MDEAQAQNEICYQLLKILIIEFERCDKITATEKEEILNTAIDKLNPLVGRLDKNPWQK
jgi:hypothetical protein